MLHTQHLTITLLVTRCPAAYSKESGSSTGYSFLVACSFLVDVDSDDFVNTIETFNPSQEQRDLFGKNVAQKMFDKILEIM